jgi:hypothetical protein
MAEHILSLPFVEREVSGVTTSAQVAAIWSFPVSIDFGGCHHLTGVFLSVLWYCNTSLVLIL